MERHVIELTDDLSYIYAVEGVLIDHTGEGLIYHDKPGRARKRYETAGSGHEAD